MNCSGAEELLRASFSMLDTNFNLLKAVVGGTFRARQRIAHT